MADFNLYLPTLLRFEGGYVNDPADPGGATNKGITLTTFKSVVHLFAGLDPTLDNLKRLTDVQAGTIYKNMYWDKLNADAIELQLLAEMYVDFYVNAGSNAVRTMQKTINGLRTAAPLNTDGKHGPSTLHAILTADQDELYKAYRAARISYYWALVNAKPALGKFLKGWLNRVAAFPEL